MATATGSIRASGAHAATTPTRRPTIRPKPDAHEKSPCSRPFSSALLMHFCSGKRCNFAPALTQAVERTTAVMADESVPAIFEAAFEYDGILIRVDVLERLGNGTWGLREVKSSTRPKDYHFDDIALQLYVLKGNR